MAKKVAVVLSGCGVNDGAEIHEAVCAMLALDRAGAEMVFVAPDKDQMDVVNHATGKPAREKRNVLVEAARIARGKIRDIRTVGANEVDAVVIPGGFGAAKNLCTFATEGENCRVDPGVEKFLRDAHAAGKPIGALCIAPALIARVFGKEFKPEITIGTDPGTGRVLEKMGARHVARAATEIAVDRKNRIVTTPCYMLAGRIGEVADGAEKAVRAVLEMA